MSDLCRCSLELKSDPEGGPISFKPILLNGERIYPKSAELRLSANSSQLFLEFDFLVLDLELDDILLNYPDDVDLAKRVEALKREVRERIE